jgi:hypothetical protein
MKCAGCGVALDEEPWDLRAYGSVKVWTRGVPYCSPACESGKPVARVTRDDLVQLQRCFAAARHVTRLWLKAGTICVPGGWAEPLGELARSCGMLVGELAPTVERPAATLTVLPDEGGEP